MTGDPPPNAPTASEGDRRPFLTLAGALRLLMLVLLVLAVSLWVDFGRMQEVLVRLPWWVFVAVVAAGSSARFLCSVRWNVLAGGLMPPPGVLELVRISLIAEFVNLWVPSSLGGEATRVVGVQRHSDLPTATASVVLDRVVGLFGLILALLPVVLLVPLPLPRWAGPVAVSVVLGCVLSGIGLRDRIASLHPRLAPFAGLSWQRVLGALALSSMAPWCTALGYVLFFSVVHPMAPGFVVGFVLLSRFGRAIPISVLGFNSVEGSMFLLGEALGIPPEVAALAVTMNLSDKLLHSLLGGLVGAVIPVR